MANISIQSIISMAEQEANASKAAANQAESSSWSAMMSAKPRAPLDTSVDGVDTRPLEEEAGKKFKLNTDLSMYQPEPLEVSMYLQSLGEDERNYATQIYKSLLG